MPAKENYVKILFKFYSDVLDEQTAETMWAEVVDESKGIYKLNSIPFYAPNIACGDTVIATYDTDEQMLTFEEIIEFSGNSTVQVVLMDKSIPTNDIREVFHDLGCATEKFREGYFVIDVPVVLNFTPIESKLKELSGSGVLDYAIPCLSDQHRV